MNITNSYFLEDDLNQTMSKLTPDQREVCQQLLNGRTITELANERELSLGKFRRRYFVPIKGVFEKNGFDSMSP